MTLSEAEGTFAVLNLCNTHNSGNIVRFNSVCLHINWKAQGEGLIKVTGSHVDWKSDNMLETVLDKDVVAIVHKQEVILIYGLYNSSNCNDLECP